jgi:hypothetical protein
MPDEPTPRATPEQARELLQVQTNSGLLWLLANYGLETNPPPSREEAVTALVNFAQYAPLPVSVDELKSGIEWACAKGQ